MRLILQLAKTILTVSRKLFQYFYVTALLISFMLPSERNFDIIPISQVNGLQFTTVTFSSSLKYCHNFQMFSNKHLIYSIKLYIGITTFVYLGIIYFPYVFSECRITFKNFSFILFYLISYLHH